MKEYLELMNVFSSNENYRYMISNNNKKISIVPKIIIGGTASLLTIGLLNTFTATSVEIKEEIPVNSPTKIVETD